ncbi:LamB/YcsF family protein [Peptococcaceae bacterium CEB3]|nr:LamB/YcsF family protein [Peptococcaceae bacterium CEB3]
MHVDLNSDLGESFGRFKIGRDEEILRVVTSANIACGFHAGDFSVMHQTIRLAAAGGAALGAHPGLPDLQGFGRRWMSYAPAEVYDLVLYQIGALAALAKGEGLALRHVKPHGALYNRAAVDPEIAAAVAAAVRDFSPALRLFGLSGSRLIEAGAEAGLVTVSEVFADRNYNADGTLVSRSQPGAMLHDPEEIARRVAGMVESGSVKSITGQVVSLKVETICLHGDESGALGTAQAIREALQAAGITVKAW